MVMMVIDDDASDDDGGGGDDLKIIMMAEVFLSCKYDDQAYLILVTDTTDGVCVKKFCPV